VKLLKLKVHIFLRHFCTQSATSTATFFKEHASPTGGVADV